MTIRERVAAGAALLDKKHPGWRERINPDTLNIPDGGCCVLGQVFGEYKDGLRALRIKDTGRAMSCGFQAAAEDADVILAEFDDLNAAWRGLLAA